MSFWIHGNSTGHLAFSNVMAAILAGQSVDAAAVNAGGTGYTVGNILTVAGGTADVAATIEVTSVAAGVIDGIRIYNSGSYSANPTTTANAVTGGTGSSATIDLTMAGTGWTVDRDAVWDGGTEREVIAHGNGAGSDSIYVGWRTYSDVGNDLYNWECHGMTGYSASFDINEQPGVSPGDHEAGDPTDYGTYMILINTGFNWWVNINSYRIIITAEIGSSFFHAYLGWGNRFGTSSEYPYPMLISTPSELHDVNSSRAAKMSSIIDPWVGSSTSNYSHTLAYLPGGGWLPFWNRRASSGYDDACVIPTQRPQVAYSTPSAAEDRFMNLTRAWADVIYSLSTGTGGATTGQLRPTGDNDDYLLLPCYLVESVPTPAILMEIDECRWCYSFGGVAAGDRFIEASGQAWHVFRNGNRSDAYAYIAIKEAS